MLHELLKASNMLHCAQLNASTKNYLKDQKDLIYAQRFTNNWSCWFHSKGNSITGKSFSVFSLLKVETLYKMEREYWMKFTDSVTREKMLLTHFVPRRPESGLVGKCLGGSWCTTHHCLLRVGIFGSFSADVTSVRLRGSGKRRSWHSAAVPGSRDSGPAGQQKRKFKIIFTTLDYYTVSCTSM